MKRLISYIIGTSLITFPLYYPVNAQEKTQTPYDCTQDLPEASSPSFLEELLEKTENCNLPRNFTDNNIQYDLSLTSYGATIYFNEMGRDLPDRQINGPGVIFTDEKGNCTRVLLREGNGIIKGDFVDSSTSPRVIFDNKSSFSSDEAQDYCTKVFNSIRDFYEAKTK